MELFSVSRGSDPIFSALGMAEGCGDKPLAAGMGVGMEEKKG